MKLLKAIFSRTTFMIIMVILEISILYVILKWFSSLYVWIETIFRIYGLVIILYIFNRSVHLSSDLIWILLIAVFPVPGSIIYGLLAADLITSKTFKKLTAATKSFESYYPDNSEILTEMCKDAPELAGQFRYIAKAAGFPFYRNTGFDYYSLGDTGFPVMLEEMRKAEKFIFLEYFIIKEGQMWSDMLEILENKASQGVDCRVMYDDVGSFSTLSFTYAKQLEAKGIKCIPFNRINPVVGIIMNHRDHRKIMVIDGKTAFSGGINLSDEYINRISRFGHWKDNVIRITGEAVWSYTVMFLTHWNALANEKDTDITAFKASPLPGEFDGYISAYGETPLDHEITAQNIYMNILNQSNNYCYIFTPYLIIDTELINALLLAAKRGVDVKLITPGIPDKRIIWHTTRSFYRTLIEGGVEIYEYTPGFVHSKVFVSDDEIAVVGTINLDYRSLYLHFENGTFLYRSTRVMDVRDDFTDTLKQCHQVQLNECRPSLFISIFRLFSSLL